MQLCRQDAGQACTSLKGNSVSQGAVADATCETNEGLLFIGSSKVHMAVGRDKAGWLHGWLSDFLPDV